MCVFVCVALWWRTGDSARGWGQIHANKGGVWFFHFCMQVCVHVRSLQLNILCSDQAYLVDPILCSLCVISFYLPFTLIQTFHQSHHPRSRLSHTWSQSVPQACWFSLQIIFHSIRSDRAINQTMTPPPPPASLETSLKDWFLRKRSVSRSGTGPRPGTGTL